MSQPTVTAVLLSWKRQANMPEIINALHSQTVPVEIWLINNAGCEDFGAERLIAMPWNAGEWARYVVAGRVETEYCLFQDDDFKLGDPTFVEQAISRHEVQCPEHIIGVAGRELQPTPPHYTPDVTYGYCHILKGHFQLFKSDIVRRVRIPRHPSASDIYWSLDAGGGEPVHWVSAYLRERMLTLDRQQVGYEFRPGHYAEREEVCAAWLKERGVIYA